MLVKSEGDALYFQESATQIATLKTGDILVSSVGEGYLKKVVSVTQTGGQWVVQTEQATLAELYENTDKFGYTGDLSLSGATLTKTTTVNATNNAEVTVTVAPDGEWTVDIKKTVAQNPSGDVTAKLTGTLTMHPKMDFGCKVKDHELVFARGVMSGTESFKAQLEVNGKLNLLKQDPPWTLARWVLPAVNVPVGAVGPVPVVLRVVPVLKLTAGVEADVTSGMTASVTQNSNFICGLEYNAPTWTDVSTFSVDCTGELPTVTNTATAKPWIKPELELLVMGVAGPNVGIEGYGKLTTTSALGSNPTYKLVGGISAEAGFEATIFSKTLVAMKKVLYEKEWVLKENALSPPSGSVALKLYANSDKSDYFLAVTPEDELDAKNNGYTFVRKEGYILASTQTDTLPLQLLKKQVGQHFEYLSTTEKDLTAYTGSGYTLVRTQGYVPTKQDPKGLLYLVLYHSTSTFDNLTCASQDTRKMAEASGSGYVSVTTLGFVYPEGAALATVSGHVYDSSTKKPVSGATVTLDGMSATSDANGFYSIPNVPPGWYSVKASAGSRYYPFQQDGIGFDNALGYGFDINLDNKESYLPVATVNVPTSSATLHVFDNEAEDGDVVLIKLNGRVLGQFTLSNAGTDFPVTLDHGVNAFTVYAVTDGNPPNTCTVDVNWQGGSQRISCEQNAGSTTYFNLVAP